MSVHSTQIYQYLPDIEDKPIQNLKSLQPWAFPTGSPPSIGFKMQKPPARITHSPTYTHWLPASPQTSHISASVRARFTAIIMPQWRRSSRATPCFKLKINPNITTHPSEKIHFVTWTSSAMSGQLWARHKRDCPVLDYLN